jgi:NADH-quinone oxidoreductase subunit K
MWQKRIDAMDLLPALFASMALFLVGMIGALLMRNVLIFFISIEMMLNAANILFVAFARHWGNEIGLVWVFFILTIAAVEAAVGFAIIINLFRAKQTIDIDQYNSLRG